MSIIPAPQSSQTLTLVELLPAVYFQFILRSFLIGAAVRTEMIQHIHRPFAIQTGHLKGSPTVDAVNLATFRLGRIFPVNVFTVGALQARRSIPGSRFEPGARRYALIPLS